jgi:ABC-2 type transport system ATP-binding protein
MAVPNLIRLARTDTAPLPVDSDFVIETEKLDLFYGRKKALNQLTLRIPRGRIHAIVGANGAGKSSLFRILLGFQSPNAGRATILGHDCTALTEHERARIGFVNEEHSLPSWLRVDELVTMQRRLYPKWDEQRYRSIVDHFHVSPEQRIAGISRGERAGVNLAMALAQKPELLILDEPTLGLDVVAKRAFLEAVLSTIDESGTTIIYCSHQMDEIERLADNLIILERGELKHMSPPDQFCERVTLWVAEFPDVPPALKSMPSVLQVQSIDGLFHFLVLDQDEDFGALLEAQGALRQYRGSVNLDRAVNAFLARNHATPLKGNSLP